LKVGSSFKLCATFVGGLPAGTPLTPTWLTVMTITPSWYALLHSPHQDTVYIKRHFANSGLSFDEIDGKFAVAAPDLEAAGADGGREAVLDAATKLVGAINVVLRLSQPHFAGFDLHGIAEKRDGKMHKVMLARGEAYGLSGVSAVGSPGSIGKPVRSKEERLVTLIARDDRIADIAQGLSIRPVTWPALTKAYETVVGIMSPKPKPENARSDYQNLIAKGWFTPDESERFYHTAALNRKGYPRSPNRNPNPMQYEDACRFIDQLVWRLVDELERN
jgi:hypothetical protein